MLWRETLDRKGCLDDLGSEVAITKGKIKGLWRKGMVSRLVKVTGGKKSRSQGVWERLVE